MVLLKIGNSYSQLSNLSIDQFRDLRELMSYFVDSGPGTRPRKVSLLSKKLEFPSGLLYIVEKYLSDVSYVWDDTRIRPITHVNAPSTLFEGSGYPTPYPEQIEAPEAIMKAGGRGIIVATTGFGKSYLTALLIDKFKVKTLVVVPRLELRRQLKESLVKWFGVQNYSKYVEVANIDSLSASNQLKDVGMIIVDEFHHAAAKSYRDLNKKAWHNVYYRIGLTATPFRSSDDERLLLESFLSQVVYRVDYASCVEKKYIVPMECYYLEIPKGPIKGNQRSYPAMYSELIVDNEYRNNLISLALGRLHSQKKATLCLVKEIRHGEILSDKTHFPFANGKDGQSEELIKAFNRGEIKTLIATTGVCGEGVDSRPAEWIIIAGAGKAKTQVMQQIGRGFRNYPGKDSCKVLLINDRSHPWFRKHYREQAAIIREEYNVEPIKLEL